MKKISLIHLSIYTVLVLIVGVFVEKTVFSKDSSENDTVVEDQNDDVYVEGKYKVSKISRVKDSFKIVFINDDKNGSLPVKVSLVSEYIHHGLEQGMSLNISFKIKKEVNNIKNKGKNKVIELDQVLVYLPNGMGGSTPVWMVAKDRKFMGLNGSKLLKMHSPTSDFSIF